MGDVKYGDTGGGRTGIPAEVLGLLESSRDGGQEALCSMAGDLMFFAELIGLQHCIMRMVRIMGDELPKEVLDMAAEIPDMEIPVLEKWAMFMEFI